jgi:hypothetical protein
MRPAAIAVFAEKATLKLFRLKAKVQPLPMEKQ